MVPTWYTPRVPTAGVPHAEPGSLGSGRVASGGGMRLEGSIAFRRTQLKYIPVAWEQQCMNSSVPSMELGIT